ncbi:MAG: hypothetical protein OEZ59_03420 [Deltaproteobacteria bacterium]|nr:hypothetical protein [Deltaproteobacteria bacterium]
MDTGKTKNRTCRTTAPVPPDPAMPQRVGPVLSTTPLRSTFLCLCSVIAGALVAVFAPAAAFPAGAPVWETRAGHMVLEAVSDSGSVYAATQSGLIQRFGLDKGRNLGELLRTSASDPASFPPAVNSLDISPSGKLLAAITSTGQMLVFSLPGGAVLADTYLRDPGVPPVIRFADENRVLVGFMNGSIALLDWKSGHEHYRRQIDYAPVTNIRLAPGGGRVAATFRSTRIRLLDLSDGSVSSELVGHTEAVYALVFMGPDILVSGGWDGRVIRWELPLGKPEVLLKDNTYVYALAWDGQGKLAAPLAGYRIGIISLKGGTPRSELVGHKAFITALHFLPGRGLLSAGSDARIILHEL